MILFTSWFQFTEQMKAESEDIIAYSWCAWWEGKGNSISSGNCRAAKHEHANWGEEPNSPFSDCTSADKAKSNHRLGKKAVKGQSNDQREGHFFALICHECHTPNMAFLIGNAMDETRLFHIFQQWPWGGNTDCCFQVCEMWNASKRRWLGRKIKMFSLAIHRLISLFRMKSMT